MLIFYVIDFSFFKKCYFIPFSLIQWGFCSCHFSEVILVSITNRHIHIKSCSKYSHIFNLLMTRLSTPTFFRYLLTWFLAHYSYQIVFFSHSFSWVPFYASSSLWTPLNIEITLLLIFINSQVFCKFLLLYYLLLWPYLISQLHILSLDWKFLFISQNLTFLLGTKFTFNNSFLIFLILKLIVMCT